MKKMLSILNNEAVGFLATIDEGKPRVRPLGFLFEDNNKLYFCTSNTKKLYQQLMSCSIVEYTKTTKEMVTVRVCGEIQFTDDKIIKGKVLEAYPPLKMLYQTADNPVFEVFYIEHGTAKISDFSGNPPSEYKF